MARHLPPNWVELPDEVLLDLKLKIEHDLDHVKRQLDAAKAGVKTNGQYSNADWFARATAAKRGLGRESQAIQTELGLRKKLHKGNSVAERLSFERRFMKVAKRRLQQEVYDSIINETHEEVEMEAPLKDFS
jgi:predicted AAA+ superfamily ATPase